MSLAQILDELPKLTPEERQQVFLRLQALGAEPEVEVTPEMLSAIDEAIQASEQGRVFTLDEVRAQAQAWITGTCAMSKIPSVYVPRRHKSGISSKNIA